jgi:inner membrane transporter RhtA
MTEASEVSGVTAESLAAGPRLGRPAVRMPGPVLAIAAIICLELGAALSVPLIGRLGPSGVVGLRLGWAALALLLFCRPERALLRGRTLAGGVALGVVTAAMTLCFFESVARIPMGTTSAIEFLGPLGVAVGGGRRPVDALWVVLAAAGVALLTDVSFDAGTVAGYAFALGGAVGWGAYILLTRVVGAAFAGFQGLTLSVGIAALLTLPCGLAGAWPALDGWMLLATAGVALLYPLLPYALEMAALRRLDTRSFGILMSLEPAVAALMGAVVLGQWLAPGQYAGMACVIAASAGATYRPSSTARKP